MSINLENLTNNPQLLLRANLALKAVYEMNNNPAYKYFPSPSEICESVAMKLSGNENLSSKDDFDLDSLNKERGIFKYLRVVEFLEKHNLVQALLPTRYWIPPGVDYHPSQ